MKDPYSKRLIELREKLESDVRLNAEEMKEIFVIMLHNEETTSEQEKQP